MGSWSKLLRRILLPVNDDDHMAPGGKPQLGAREIAELRWWVESGASETNTIAGLRPPKDILNILAAQMQSN